MDVATGPAVQPHKNSGRGDAEWVHVNAELVHVNADSVRDDVDSVRDGANSIIEIRAPVDAEVVIQQSTAGGDDTSADCTGKVWSAASVALAVLKWPTREAFS